MNTVQTIAETVRQHYLHRLLEEHKAVKRKIAGVKAHNRNNVSHQWSLVTDCDLIDNGNTVKFKDIVPVHKAQKTKMYRHDMVLFRDNKPVKPYMCWPVLSSDDGEFVEEDFPVFSPYSATINATEIEINPFPWFVCNFVFYPNAETVKGIIDLWFRNWFYPTGKPDPFCNVVHRIDGPYRQKGGGELYQFDFGTAPGEAFWDLISQVCRTGVKRIIIY